MKMKGKNRSKGEKNLYQALRELQNSTAGKFENVNGQHPAEESKEKK